MQPLHPNTDEMPIKMVADRKNGAIADETKNSGREEAWPCRIGTRTNTSKDMAKDEKTPTVP